MPWLDGGPAAAAAAAVETKAPTVYPKRSELRRAEARAARSGSRRGHDRRPSGGRPATRPARQGPVAPTAAAPWHGPRATEPLRGPQAPFPPVELRQRRQGTPPGGFPRISGDPVTPLRGIPGEAFTPAPRSTPTSPPTSTRPGTPQPSGPLPIIPASPAFGIPLSGLSGPLGPLSGTADPAAWTADEQLARPAPRSGRRRAAPPATGRARRAAPAPAVAPSSGRVGVAAARLLVLAMVVGAEGVAATTMAATARTAPLEPGAPEAADGAPSAAAVLADADERQRAAMLADMEGLTVAAAQWQSAGGKVAAALQQAKAAADRIRAAAEARREAMRNAQRDPKSVARLLVADRGWSSTQFTCLDKLWTRESKWNYRAYNPSSGAYGIPQALPGSKMATEGSDWRTNPVTQIKWGLNYIADRYGTPCGAWAHSQATGWY